MNKPEFEFAPFPKIPRLQRDIVITEKIDGTNGGIFISEEGEVYASSRNRWITTEDDNYGFAQWVKNYANVLSKELGPGMHFGEWWGKGIQRNYGLEEKRFSLFNVHRWGKNRKVVDERCERYKKGPHITSKGQKICACRDAREELVTDFGLGVVPVLYRGPFEGIPWTLDRLSAHGSYAAPGFMDPEGIVVYHTAAKQFFKYTLDGDGHKG